MLMRIRILVGVGFAMYSVIEAYRSYRAIKDAAAHRAGRFGQ